MFQKAYGCYNSSSTCVYWKRWKRFQSIRDYIVFLSTTSGPTRQCEISASERTAPDIYLHSVEACVWVSNQGVTGSASQWHALPVLFYDTSALHGQTQDNCTQEELESIVNGEFESSTPRPIKGTFASQIPGSSVITFKLWYTSRKVKTAARHVTESDLRCQFSMGGGWVTVLDPIDDVLMYHSVSFEYNSKNDVEGYRIAWVMRWLSQTHDYFVDTCGLRRTQAMLSIYGQQMTCDSQFPDTRRNILC